MRAPSGDGHLCRPFPPHHGIALRILLDYRPALRERSGVGEYVYQLTRALAARAVEHGRGSSTQVSVFSSSWKDRLKLPDLPAIHTVDRRIPVQVLNWAWHRLEWPPIEMLAGPFDVVHSPHPLLIPAREAARVVTIHDLDFLKHPERTHGEIRRDYPTLARDHARRADQIIVPSEYTATQVTELLDVDAGRITVCPHGAPEWPARETPAHSGYLLFLGTLEPRKNVPGLLRAYDALLRRRPAAPDLVIAGARGAAANEVFGMMGTARLNGRARYAGYVQPEERRALYKGASMLVMPSFDEGFGLPVLEAMAVGVPVIAARRGALPEVLGDAGLLVDPEDPTAIATSMEQLLDDPGLSDACADRGRARAAHFTWRDAAERALEAYANAIGHRAGR